MLTHVVDQSTSNQTLILVGDLLPEVVHLLETLKPRLEIIPAKSMQEAVELVQNHPFSRLLEFHEPESSLTELLFWPKIFDHYPDGVAITNQQQQIIWHNHQFAKYLTNTPASINQNSAENQNPASQQTQTTSLVGKNIHEAISMAQLQDGAKSPLTIARLKGKQSSAILKFSEKLYCELEVIPINKSGSSEISSNQFTEIIFLRDYTSSILQQKKLDAIFQAMSDFGDFTAEDLEQLTVDERIEILRQNILHHTDILWNSILLKSDYSIIKLRD